MGEKKSGRIGEKIRQLKAEVLVHYQFKNKRRFVMNKINCFVLLGLFVLCGLFCSKNIMAAVNADGSVAISAENFPDETFRNFIVKMYDSDGDSLLTKEQLGAVESMTLGIRTAEESDDGLWEKKGNFSVDGIQYFKNLKEIDIYGYEYMQGTLKKNTNLKKIGLHRIKYEKGKVTIAVSKINKQFPVKQIKTCILTGYECRTFNMSQMNKLEQLLVNGNHYDRNLSKIQNIDLSKNKNLKRLDFQQIQLKKLDLRKNKKLSHVSVVSGFPVSKDYEEGTGDEPGYLDYYSVVKGTKNQILLPKKNKITEMRYFSSNKQIDVSNCSKLKILQVSKGMKVKLLRKWYKKSSLLIQKNANPVYSVKIPKRGRYMWA